MRDTSTVLADWYDGEIGGEALFWRLAEQGSPAAAPKWLALAAIEGHVAARLLTAIGNCGFAVPDTAATLAGARERADAVAAGNWRQSMEWLRSIALEALAEMSVEARQLPTDLAALGALVVRHEQVLVEFAELELAGRGSVSLRPVDALLATLRSRAEPAALASTQH
jgi:hypothetical protein